MIELLGTNNLSSVVQNLIYLLLTKHNTSLLTYFQEITFVLYLDAAFMSYFSEIYNFLKELNIFIIAFLVNEDEYIRSAKKLYDAKTV